MHYKVIAEVGSLVSLLFVKLPSHLAGVPATLPVSSENYKTHWKPTGSVLETPRAYCEPRKRVLSEQSVLRTPTVEDFPRLSWEIHDGRGSQYVLPRAPRAH